MTLETSNHDLRVLFNTLNGVLSDIAWVRELDTTEKREAYLRTYGEATQQKLADASRLFSRMVESVAVASP